ncbi:N-acetyltransferase [Paenibacillus sp. 1781tsa1]|uniref:GNAT family N-acetyltransferase n=1 Tax=Paenibacillus sp. 1781tsa1 TaxID=2953810 RepID=UPI00209F54E7|nr:GNAT family N-acetyltransferase [Paenibacillus sp. 1781tsa1]MCP1184126.1 GNAT family N-acetyltransferase [Paenibacillus sp. 1781tsa1]
MNKISIKKASPHSLVGGQLNQMALEYMAYSLAGTKDKSILEKTFNKLWRSKQKRFSHQYAYEAEMGSQTLGMIMCYPTTLMNKLALPTFSKLFELRKWSLIKYNLQHWKEFYSMVTLKEAENDEYHIGTLATLPESRGLGVGTQLIQYAEEQAITQGLSKSSLTVKKENARAIQLYERLGYQRVGEINKPSLSLYRMSKILV